MQLTLEKSYIAGKPVRVDDLGGQLFGGEANAHKFVITQYAAQGSSETVAITGEIAATMMVSSGATVPVTGYVQGGKAVIVLTSACYSVPGRFVLSIFANDGNISTCIYCGVGNVLRTSTDTVVYPTESLPNLSQLVAQVQAAIDSFPADLSAIQSALALPYEQLTFPVKAGAYAWHAGKLYEANQDISTAESWTSAHWKIAHAASDLAADVAELRAAIDEAAGNTGGGRPMIWCWGDSLTEGVGGWVMQPDGHNAYMAYSYPSWVGQTWDVVNFGSRSEDCHAIMARQGADPIVLQQPLAIPASKDTPVLIQQVTEIYNITSGQSFRSRSGALVKINKEVESAGLNPCVIGGVEGILYRELTNQSLNNETTYNYYFRRLEDGEAVTAAAGTEIESYAMRHCHGGVAIIWMGANGGYTSVANWIEEVESMLEYGEYDSYLIIISREFSGAALQTIKDAFTDADGMCHVISLMEQLPYRGYAMAGIPFQSVDTSGWATTDPIKKNAPLLCEYLSGQSGENQFGTLHYSAWGYKAIGKLVVEKLGTMGLVTHGGGGGGGGGGSEPETDAYGTLLYKLSTPRTLSGESYINTRIKLYDDVTKSWTFAIKWSGTPTSPQGWPANIFCCSLDGSWKGLLYRYYQAGGANLLFGALNNVVSRDNPDTTNHLIDNYGSTNVIIIAKDGDSYTVHCNSSSEAFGHSMISALTEADAINLPLLIGARYNAEGTEIHYRTAFTVEDCRVYDSALESDALAALYEEMSA